MTHLLFPLSEKVAQLVGLVDGEADKEDGDEADAGGNHHCLNDYCGSNGGGGRVF